MKNLEQIREQRQEQIKDYIAKVSQTTEAMAQDPYTMHVLEELEDIFDDHGPKSQEYSISHRKHASGYNDFIKRHGFYDLFLIDAHGDIVYTVKKEEDFGRNVMHGDFIGTHISKCFSQAFSEGISFVSFNYYDPSQDVATFIGAAIKDASGQTQGVLAIQLTIQTINSLLTDRKALGRTGESYLVDLKHRMLTESRFYGKNTILNQIVKTVAARKALEGGKGCEIIQDYRGVAVLSAYSSIDIGDVRWAILVEIDQDEVILNLSGPEKKVLFADIVQKLDRSPSYKRIKSVGKLDEVRYRFMKGKKIIEVKLGELKKASQEEILFTTGVVTCTAVTLGKKKRFGYLTHIMPVDKSYGLNVIVRKVWLRKQSTDLIEKLLREIEQLTDPKEIEDLQAGIFAIHTKSLPYIVERLLEYGVRSSHIRFVHGPQNGYLTSYYNYLTDTTYIRWNSDDDRRWIELDSEILKETKSIGEIIEDILKQQIKARCHPVTAC